MFKSIATNAVAAILLSTCSMAGCSGGATAPRLVGSWEAVLDNGATDFSTAVAEAIEDAGPAASESVSAEADFDAYVVRYGSDGKFNDEMNFAGVTIASRGTWSILESSEQTIRVELKIEEKKVGNAAPQPSASTIRQSITFDGPDAIDVSVEGEDGATRNWRLRRRGTR